MNRKSRGFTLIEVMLAMFLSIIILTMGINLFIKYYKNYTTMKSSNIITDNIDDALISLDIILKGNMIKAVEVREDRESKLGEICISYAIDHFDDSKIKKKTIKFQESTGKIIVETKTIENLQVTSIHENTILKNVKKFFITKKGEVFYFRIIHKSGEERIGCI